MKLGNLNILLENEDYKTPIKRGHPVAILKTRENLDGTYSNYAELFNCNEKHAKFIDDLFKKLQNNKAGECIE